MSTQSSNSTQKPLQHLGFIVDGNRRWARMRNLPTFEGHRRGMKKVEMVIEKLIDTEVKYVSFYVFSVENWQRSPKEVEYLMRLINEHIDGLLERAKQHNLRICICGHSERVDPKLWAKLMAIEQETADNTGLTVCYCFNYSGQWEIADAVTKARSAGAEEFTPELIRQHLYHPEVPDLDLVVRTSGEQRLSGFQIWRSAYAEFLFLEMYFPDLTAEDCDMIINEFHQRERRFGQ